MADENKQQTSDSFVVKDVDGRLKVYDQGTLRELDQMLSSTQVRPAADPVTPAMPMLAPVAPKFTDLAVIPEEAHFLSPAATPAKGTGVATLDFHPGDKADLEKELNKLQGTFGVSAQKQYSIEKISRTIATKQNLKFAEAESSAFTKILLAFFRQVRNQVDTKLRLTSGREVGGLGVSEGQADAVVAVARTLRDRIEEQDGIVVSEETVSTSMPAVSSSRNVTAIEPEKTLEPKSEPKKEAPTQPMQPQTAPAMPPVSSQRKPGLRPVMPTERMSEAEPIARPKAPMPTPPPIVQAPIEPKPVVQEKPRETLPPLPIKPIAPVTEPIVQNVVRRDSPSAAMQDVRGTKGIRKPQLIGRVDELQNVTLETWRMLDADPRIRAGKILGKIQNLERESFTRKSQGIDAWRSSETYQNYLMIGQRSLEQGKDIAKVIEGIRAEGRETLDLAEFEAISDLNRALRF